MSRCNKPKASHNPHMVGSLGTSCEGQDER